MSVLLLNSIAYDTGCLAAYSSVFGINIGRCAGIACIAWMWVYAGMFGLSVTPSEMKRVAADTSIDNEFKDYFARYLVDYHLYF